MLCCGEERKTGFCSECGRPLIEPPLVGLMAHLRKRLASDQKRLAHLEDDATPAFREKLQRTVEKWKSWRNALMEMIEKCQPS